jgi:hypothetical protein
MMPSTTRAALWAAWYYASDMASAKPFSFASPRCAMEEA